MNVFNVFQCKRNEINIYIFKVKNSHSNEIRMKFTWHQMLLFMFNGNKLCRVLVFIRFIHLLAIFDLQIFGIDPNPNSNPIVNSIVYLSVSFIDSLHCRWTRVWVWEWVEYEYVIELNLLVANVERILRCFVNFERIGL